MRQIKLAANTIRRWLSRFRKDEYARLARQYEFPGGYQRVYHYHVRKTGGGSLNLMFLALGGELSDDVKRRVYLGAKSRAISNGKVYVGWNKYSIEQGHYYYAWSHIPAHELHLPKDTFTFTCLRDPVARVLSLYKMLYEHRLANSKHPMMVKQGPWLGSSFGDFLNRIPREHLLRQLYMFSPSFSVEEASERIQACSYFFFLEDFGQGVSALSKRLQVELQPHHAHKSTINPTFSDADLDQLRTSLQPEYQLYQLLKAAHTQPVIKMQTDQSAL